MKIAHLSDLHVLAIDGVPATRLWTNKRATGMLNLKLHRKSKHKPYAAEAAIEDLRSQNVDHVLISGDVSNLSLETEFAAVLAMIERLPVAPENVSIVPGNHDVYTRGAQKSQRFFNTFAKYLGSDRSIEKARNAHPSGVFPYVKLRDGVAIVGLSSAVVRPPILSSGWVGDEQLAALDQLLALPEIAERTLLVMMHHPLINPQNAWRNFSRGFAEAPLLQQRLLQRDRTMFVHGHLHEAAHRTLTDGHGHQTPHLGTTSTSLIHDGGYNLYEVDATGFVSATFRRFNGENKGFLSEPLPVRDSQFAG